MSKLRDCGIQVMQKEKDYTRLRVMMHEYVKINDFVDNLLRKNLSQNRHLYEDKDLFIKHINELSEVDDHLKKRINQIKQFYEEFSFKYSSIR